MIVERFVVLKGMMFFVDGEFKARTRRVEEAGLFSEAEAKQAVEGVKGDGWSYQPLGFYKDFLIGERVLIDEKLAMLGIGK